MIILALTKTVKIHFKRHLCNLLYELILTQCGKRAHRGPGQEELLTGGACAGCFHRRAEKKQWQAFDTALASPAGCTDSCRRH